MLRAVVYTRVSTDEQVTHGTSLVGQKESCLAKAATMGATVVGIFEEPGVSGGLFEGRPQLQAALAMLERKEASVLIVYNVSRLSRDVEHLAMIRKRIKILGAKLVFCLSSYEETATGKMAFYIEGMMAEGERDTIRERTITGRLRRVGEGRMPCPAMRPFGYYIVSKLDVVLGRYPEEMTHKYVIMEEEAQWARAIFRKYASGISLFSIGRYLQDNGVPTHRGGRAWHPNTVSGILKNPVYKGQAAFGKRQRIVDPSRLEKGYKRPDYSQKLEPEHWKYIQVPALVSEQEWDACQRRFSENKERLGGNRERRYALTGLVRCPVCNRCMMAKKSRGSRKYNIHYVHYHCKDYSERCYLTGTVCHAEHYNLDWLSEVINHALTAVIQEPGMLSEAVAAYREGCNAEKVEADVIRVQALIKALESREKSTVQAQIAGIQKGADPGLYDTEFADIAEKRSAYQLRLSHLLQEQESLVPRLAADADIMQETLAEVLEALTAPELEAHERHQLLARVIYSIVPSREEVRLTLRPWDSAQTVQRIVIRRSGKSSPVLRIALRTRSLDSFTAASGRPTMVNMGTDDEISTSTRTMYASMPRIAEESTWEST